MSIVVYIIIFFEQKERWEKSVFIKKRSKNNNLTKITITTIIITKTLKRFVVYNNKIEI